VLRPGLGVLPALLHLATKSMCTHRKSEINQEYIVCNVMRRWRFNESAIAVGAINVLVQGVRRPAHLSREMRNGLQVAGID